MPRSDQRLDQQSIDRFVTRLVEPKRGEIDLGVPAGQELKVAVERVQEFRRRREADASRALLDPINYAICRTALAGAAMRRSGGGITSYYDEQGRNVTERSAPRSLSAAVCSSPPVPLPR